ncbi:hypothetical protein IW140_005251 [Coemansia sp. RSA 1813]|nr:hypothetical protein EV178_004283 [Coemansia sp. RSA 1646]KAJ1770854.1 hypothetical protein LPJ74_002840 [Coemansia sp. RSA 1843]KAJ2087096.1 hypothetical protein IW138_005194 [Coemansia sp. RSA 986]KAJ2211730.1 hypothetical protein EV179_005231 [Coemansia sp. RSA 487]KAJ2565615.1 hypothetical protein IW140_005251 [Coemansia sp. RSA 1813]
MKSVFCVIIAFVATITLICAAPIPADVSGVEDQNASSASETVYYTTWDTSRLDAIFDTVDSELGSLGNIVDQLSDITIPAPSLPSDWEYTSLTGPAYTTWGPSQFESFMGSDFSMIASFYPDYTPTGQYSDNTDISTEPSLTTVGEDATTSVAVDESVAEPTSSDEYAATTTTTEEQATTVPTAESTEETTTQISFTTTEYVRRCSH